MSVLLFPPRSGLPDGLYWIVPPEVCGPEIAEGGVGGLVTCLSHEACEVDAGLAGRGGKARAQRVPGEALGPLDARVAGGLAHEARDRAVAEPGGRQAAGLAHAHEQRRLRCRFRWQPVEIRTLVAHEQPSLQRHDGAQSGVCVVGAEALVGFRGGGSE